MYGIVGLKNEVLVVVVILAVKEAYHVHHS